MKVNKKLELLKENEEDFEWYPTTNEIMEEIQKDIIKTVTNDKFKYGNRSKIKYDRTYSKDEKDKIIIDSILDIGAGDGRVIDYLTKDTNQYRIWAKQKLAIEKAKTQGNDLIKAGIGLIGRDFYETTLIDKNYDIVFSNPPYSIFKDWTYKILQEVNSSFIYLVIPERWDDDVDFKTAINQKGKIDILGDFDFSNADRKARANVQLIKITKEDQSDTFTSWIESNFGKFETEVEEIIEEDEEESNQLEQRSENNVKVLVENYNKDLYELNQTYKTLGSLDFSIIEQLGVKKEDVISKIKSDISSLKNVYWKKAFDIIEPITKRLTHTTRQKILEDIKWFNSLDFNEDNAYSIVIWVIDNYNKYTKEQMIKAYDDITDFENVRAYKSNDAWMEDKWRYNKPVPTKYSLDYRIVVAQGHKLNVQYSYQNSCGEDTILKDLQIVANSLGFITNDELAHDTGKKHFCKMKDDKVLFEYKVYQNNNVHFKFDQKFLQVLNIEVGKLRGWIKKPQDIQEEFKLTEKEALEYFTNSELCLLGNDNAMLLLS